MRIDLSRLPEVINSKYLPLLTEKNRYLTVYGSAGSGKSHFLAQKWIIRILIAMESGKVHRFYGFRKTQPAVRKSVFPLVKKYINDWGLDHLVKIYKQEMIVSWTGGSEIMCLGLDEPDKLKSIEGMTGAWLEEATEFTLDDFTQIDLRIRGETDSYKQIFLSFNPISKLNWVYREFFEKQKGVRVHTTYKDNKFLDKEYIEILEGLKDQDTSYYQIYALGEWGSLQGLVYNNWDVVDEFPENCDEVIYGLDFGFNNPTALLKIGIKDKVNVYIEELIYESKLTNTDLISRINELMPEKQILIKADSAEPDRIEEITRAGFWIEGARKGRNSVKDGIDVVKRKKLHITKNSVNVIKEIQSYKWREAKDGNHIDEPLKFLDHSMDALRYGIGDMEESEILVWDL